MRVGARAWLPAVEIGESALYEADCLEWLADAKPESIHGVVTDPPYGLVEYSRDEQAKLRRGRGGVWRMPPSFDGHRRSPLPRFTTLTDSELEHLEAFFEGWAGRLLPVLVPGAHVMVASNPLVSYRVAAAVCRAGFERRGEIVRLVMTMRGDSRPPRPRNPQSAGQGLRPRTRAAFWRRNLGHTSSLKGTPGSSAMIRSSDRPIGK